jgi:hypothetical protein
MTKIQERKSQWVTLTTTETASKAAALAGCHHQWHSVVCQSTWMNPAETKKMDMKTMQFR